MMPLFKWFFAKSKVDAKMPSPLSDKRRLREKVAEIVGPDIAKDVMKILDGRMKDVGIDASILLLEDGEKEQGIMELLQECVDCPHVTIEKSSKLLMGFDDLSLYVCRGILKIDTDYPADLADGHVATVEKILSGKSCLTMESGERPSFMLSVTNIFNRDSFHIGAFNNGELWAFRHDGFRRLGSMYHTLSSLKRSKTPHSADAIESFMEPLLKTVGEWEKTQKEVEETQFRHERERDEAPREKWMVYVEGKDDRGGSISENRTINIAPDMYLRHSRELRISGSNYESITIKGMWRLTDDGRRVSVGSFEDSRGFTIVLDPPSTAK